MIFIRSFISFVLGLPSNLTGKKGFLADQRSPNRSWPTFRWLLAPGVVVSTSEETWGGGGGGEAAAANASCGLKCCRRCPSNEFGLVGGLKVRGFITLLPPAEAWDTIAWGVCLWGCFSWGREWEGLGFRGLVEEEGGWGGGRAGAVEDSVVVVVVLESWRPPMSGRW